MEVKIRYFSVFKDITGKKVENIVLDNSIRTVQDLLKVLVEKYPKLKEWLNSQEIIVVVDGRVYDPEEKLPDSMNEVGIMPPISGGGNYGFVEKIEPEKLLGSLLHLVDEDVGAIALFIGRVKGLLNGKKVLSLYYETYEPNSTNSLARIVEEEREKIGFKEAYVYHKEGEALPGEPVLFIAVTSRGRKEALKGLTSILERVKHEAFVWKLEKREDGEFWILGDGKRIKRQ